MPIKTRKLLVNPAAIEKIFSSKIARSGGIVRCNVGRIEQSASLAQLKAAVQQRRFHMLRAGSHYLIFCNPGKFELIC